MEKLKTFVAIDFEWQSTDHDPCAIGMVKVKNNAVVSQYYSLIRPEHDVWDEHCCRIHGITREMVADEPTLAEMEPLIEVYTQGFTLVGHNFAQAEAAVIRKHFREGSPLKAAPYIDTHTLLGGSLPEQCAAHGIPLDQHHDALQDALATARLYIKVQGDTTAAPLATEPKPKKKSGSRRDASLNYAVEADQVPHPDTPFMGATFVVSGFPDAQRDRLIALLRDRFGGKNSGSISGKTKILVGHSAKCGPSKLEKARAAGCIIYNESSLFDEVILPHGLGDEWNNIFN